MLDLVDLAGSERLRISKAKGARLEECKHINQSLSALSKVIGSLAENPKRRHVSYRDSKLTRLLKESLGGNSKTSLIACISPSQDSFSETLSTLHFACKAKLVKNEMVRNFETRRLVEAQTGSEDPAKHLLEYLRKIENEKQRAQADFLSREEMEQFSQRKHKSREDKMRPNGEQEALGKMGTDNYTQKMLKIEKKNRGLKEKLRVCEREREIALNALQQQAEHFSREKTRRKKLEEKVEELELLLELEKSEKKGQATSSKAHPQR